MNRFPKLRATIQKLVLASLPLVAAGCCGNYEPPHDERVEVIDPDSVAYGNLVEKCRTDDGSCVQLCDTVLIEEGIITEAGEVTYTECRLIEDGSTEVHMVYWWPDQGCIAGRRPVGLGDRARRTAPSAVGTWLAGMTYLEAAAVYAFVITGNELDRFGAPENLVRRAFAAAEDEIRHTRIAAALARRHGVEPTWPTVAATPPRPLLEFARENAVEGCVRETFGAVVATWQAHMAGDPLIRDAMAGIARDETGHAALSADIDTWLQPRLSPAERRDVASARAEAIETLLAGAGAPVLPELVAVAGLPGPADAKKLARAVRAAVWA